MRIPTTMKALTTAGLLLATTSWASGGICELGQTWRDRIDSVSCLSCHDGSLAPPVHANLPSLSFEMLSEAATTEGSHPVEIDYEAARARRPGALAPSQALPLALVLTDGKLTCATCHDGHSLNDARVSMTMDRSLLCVTCHAGI